MKFQSSYSVKSLWILLPVLPIVILLWILPVDYLRGAAMGWIENFCGRQEIKVWGNSNPEWFYDYKAIMMDKYKIYVNHTSEGSFLPLAKSRYYEGYNFMMKKQIVKKYGSDVFAESEKAAVSAYEFRNKTLNQVKKQ